MIAGVDLLHFHFSVHVAVIYKVHIRYFYLLTLKKRMVIQASTIVYEFEVFVNMKFNGTVFDSIYQHCSIIR